MQNQQNPLFQFSSLPNRAIPFDQIRVEHFQPALENAIKEAKSDIARIKANPEPANFANTIEALEHAGPLVNYVASVFFNQMSAHTNDDLQALAPDMGARLSELSSDMLLDADLFARVKAVYDQKPSLNPEAKQLLENTYKDFVRNGALLSEDLKAQLREIDQKMAKLTPKFSENTLKATNAFELHLQNESDLAGLPESARAAAAASAQERGHKEGWSFTLHGPSFEAFMKYADKRELREKMWKAAATKCVGGEFDNSDIVLEIVRLRRERAKILGYPTHASYVLEKRMAEKPDEVHRFLQNLLKVYRPAAERDVKAVTELAQSLGLKDRLMPWDYSYYAEKLKQRTLNFNDEDLRPYFQLEKVVEGVFAVAERLYGVRFVPTDQYPIYHPDVKVFEVREVSDNSLVGIYFTDYFPRASKNAGAWMTNYHEQMVADGQDLRPHVAIVCNFTKPLPDKPSLLNFREVETLFHEFGHALHGLLSKVKYRSLAGTNVFWDFVELPSQVMENWASETEALHLFARHYQTGEKLPQDLLEKLIESGQFLAGYMGLRQIQFALLDMAWHDQTRPEDIRSVTDFERSATSPTQILPPVEGTNFSSSFGHIFAGGYSSGYYSYKWAEVLDADAFELFKEKGLFDPATAQSFRQNILSRGGSEPPSELYRRFRGRDADPQALFRREGLL